MELFGYRIFLFVTVKYLNGPYEGKLERLDGRGIFAPYLRQTR
jgi:hypothetical protein